MTSSLPDKRRYSDREVRQILDRATEIQSEGGLPDTSAAEGMTLDELEDIAREAGIDPRLIRRAADEMAVATPVADISGGLLGAPAQLRLHRIVEGEVSADTMDSLISVIENVAGVGEPRLIGHTLSWSSGESDRKLRVSVESGEGRTLIRADEDMKEMAGGLFGGVIGGVGGGVGFGVGMGVGLGALGSPLFAILFPTGVIAACYFAVRKGFGSIVRRRHEEMQRIVDGIAAEVSARAEERRLPEGG